MADALEEYFSGMKLWGNDFSQKEIEEWYQDEKEGYSNLGAKDSAVYSYGYHALNKYHAFDRLNPRTFSNVLGLGSAYGEEFVPIQKLINNLTILDPSDKFDPKCKVKGRCEYKKPAISGDLQFASDTFDLIVCLGVLHHIPNVSHVVSESYRCLKPGGHMIVREPIVSMGDWRTPRRGLTKRERGIPINILKEIYSDNGFEIVRQQLCIFPPLVKAAKRLGISVYNSRNLVIADALLSAAFAFNVKYHRTSLMEKFAPASLFSMLQKPMRRSET